MKTNARAETALKALYRMALDEAKTRPLQTTCKSKLAYKSMTKKRRSVRLWLAAAALVLCYSGVSIGSGSWSVAKQSESYAGLELLNNALRESELVHDAIEYFQHSWQLESGTGGI
ncbi:MAG: hypothetical protein KKI09_02600 [Spirochaetes bacterium]|nr:hypothetical protein [Spirochaetota bacterium]MBU0954295.1 hypothetical protein [Spirochaetota bacterium]